MAEPHGAAVFMLAAVRGGRLWLAPLGAPCDLDSLLWVEAGPAPDVVPPWPPGEGSTPP